MEDGESRSHPNETVRLTGDDNGTQLIAIVTAGPASVFDREPNEILEYNRVHQSAGLRGDPLNRL